MESYGARPVVDVDNRPLGPTQNTDLRLNTGDVGILKSTLLPSFTLHSGLTLASYVAARATDKGELKDYNWPTSQVANAWWSAIGRRMYHDHLPFTTAWNVLPWNEKLLLGSVTLWGTRLFYHIVSRSVSRGKDNPRYDELKEQDSGFWNKAFYLLFVPEAVFLTFISLPFTLPFRLSSSSLSLAPEVSCALRSIGVGLFGAGFALETLADTQLTLHRRERADLCRHGVWSIVRHPNYLGDTLVHSSFILLNAVNNFNPFILLGPLANYLYLRLVGGDKQNEPSQEARYQAKDPHKLGQLQEWRSEKNSFWPSLTELVNPWTWVVIGSGVLGVVVEEGARAYFA